MLYWIDLNYIVCEPARHWMDTFFFSSGNKGSLKVMLNKQREKHTNTQTEEKTQTIQQKYNMFNQLFSYDCEQYTQKKK